jgi:hypothetical protein
MGNIEYSSFHNKEYIMYKNYLKKIIAAFVMLLVVMIFISGCSDSTGPDNGNNNIINEDVPKIPKPSHPGGETGAYSDTVTVISPLSTNYRPLITVMYLSEATSKSRGYLYITFMDQSRTSSWVSQDVQESIWSDQVEFIIPNIYYANGGQIPAPPLPILSPVTFKGHLPWDRILLMENGEILPPQPGQGGINTIWTRVTDIGIGNIQYQEKIQCQFGYTAGESLSSVPSLRRDRFWVRRPLEGGVGNFLLLTGNTQGEIATSYTSGTSTTETETFGRSVTASAGLSFGGLSAGIEVTLSQSFSTSVTVSEESSVSFTKTVSGENGKIVHFQVWELVERYTITDSKGEPFTDPNYLFEPVELHIRGVAVALEATTFDE